MKKKKETFAEKSYREAVRGAMATRKRADFWRRFKKKHAVEQAMQQGAYFQRIP